MPNSANNVTPMFLIHIDTKQGIMVNNKIGQLPFTI